MLKILSILKKTKKPDKTEVKPKKEKEKEKPKRLTERPSFNHPEIESFYREYILGNVFFIGRARDEIISLLKELDKRNSERVRESIKQIKKAVSEMDGTYINRKALVLLLTRASKG